MLIYTILSTQMTGEKKKMEEISGKLDASFPIVSKASLPRRLVFMWVQYQYGWVMGVKKGENSLNNRIVKRVVRLFIIHPINILVCYEYTFV